MELEIEIELYQQQIIELYLLESGHLCFVRLYAQKFNFEQDFLNFPWKLYKAFQPHDWNGICATKPYIADFREL